MLFIDRYWIITGTIIATFNQLTTIRLDGCLVTTMTSTVLKLGCISLTLIVATGGQH